MTGQAEPQPGPAAGARTPTETTTITGDGGVIECLIVPWDTAAFGFPVAEIARFELGADGRAAGLLQELDAWCAERDVRLVSCRLDHARLRESIALEGLGFRFIEMVHGPFLQGLDGVAAPRHRIVVDEATVGDLAAIEEVAADAFTTGRFLLDPRLDPAASRRRYASWVRSSLDHPSQVLLRARIDGQLVGFFIVEDRVDRSVYWHLTAVAPGRQGQGIGRSLWQTMLLRHRDAGATSVQTTISAHNAPVINLYARLGFSFGSPRMTFHWLREPGR
jgi:GNAT superfamily N-acetyltransferase